MFDESFRVYGARTAEDKSPRELRRCLKSYVAREIHVSNNLPKPPHESLSTTIEASTLSPKPINGL